jgi:hypothetical protein
VLNENVHNAIVIELLLNLPGNIQHLAFSGSFYD